MKICCKFSPSGHPRCRGVCFFIRSADPLQWMGAVRMRVQTADKNITSTPHYSSPSVDVLWRQKLHVCMSSQDVNWWTGVVWIIVMFLSAVWILILTAPIHCKGYIGEQVMQCYISPNLMKKQTYHHPLNRATTYVFIVSYCCFLFSLSQMLKNISWYTERVLTEISLGSLLILVVIRTIQFNMTRTRVRPEPVTKTVI